MLANSEIEQYRYSDFFESARKSLWENIKTLDEKSGVHLFPKNIDEIKQKFEANKEKFQQSKNYSEFAEYCRECNPYTAFQGLRNRVNFPLKNHSLEFVPNMREYKELKITDSNLKTALLTRLDYSSPSEFDQSDWFFRNSLFRKMDFHPFNIEAKGEYNNNVWQLEFFNDKSYLLFKVNFTEILENIAEIMEYNMQLKMDSSIAKEFNKLLAITQDSPQDNY